jgi:SAM-dependent methyltransferase
MFRFSGCAVHRASSQSVLPVGGFEAEDDLMSAQRSTRAAAGQVSSSAAEVYEKFFVPALFGQWVPRMLDAVGAVAGDRLLDVGTGTAVLARAALRRVSPGGSVVAVDPNAGMLDVAHLITPALDLRLGTAEQLPFGADEFNCVTCQFALMFVTDRARAVSEFARVLEPGGRVAVATWAGVEESPGYAEVVELLDDELGGWAAAAMRAPFTIGTADQLGDLLEPAFPDVSVRRHDGEARFDSLDAWMHTEIRGWTLAEHVDDDQFARLLEHARTRLGRFVDGSGRVSFAAPALIASATVRHQPFTASR